MTAVPASAVAHQDVVGEAFEGVALAAVAKGPDRNAGLERIFVEGRAPLALDPKDEPREAGGDLDAAVQCLRNLSRNDEIDEFREKVITIHAANWRLLAAAARTFLYGEHYGYMIAGEFKRADHRGGGKVVAGRDLSRRRTSHKHEEWEELS